MNASSALSIPPRAGAGLKPEHVPAILAGPPCVGFFEIHAENYMGAGGPPHAHLAAIRSSYPLSLHGVALSIGASRPLDRDHLDRLKRLVERYEPGLFSEHLAWSSHADVFLNDLLPVPYTPATLARVCDHIDEVQAHLGRRMLLENPSTYLAFAESTLSEVEFLAAVVRRTGCGLLLDVNNVFVSVTNHGTSASAYLQAFPLTAVEEIHLAGHDVTQDDTGAPLLLDTHDRKVADPVWALYRDVVDLIGPRPTLIEWDADLPDGPVLAAEAARAEAIMAARSGPQNGRAFSAHAA